jgi:hypothetical protein
MSRSVYGELEFSSVTLMLFAKSHPGRIGWLSACGAREGSGAACEYT